MVFLIPDFTSIEVSSLITSLIQTENHISMFSSVLKVVLTFLIWAPCFFNFADMAWQNLQENITKEWGKVVSAEGSWTTWGVWLNIKASQKNLRLKT